MMKKLIFYSYAIAIISIHFVFWLATIYAGVKIAQWLEWIK